MSKAYYCCGFIPASDEKNVDKEGHAVSSFDLVAGGSNGYPSHHRLYKVTVSFSNMDRRTITLKQGCFISSRRSPVWYSGRP